MPGQNSNAATQLANNYAAMIGHVWFFMGGSLIALMMSIFDQTRRTALRLIVGCVFGGVGAVVAGMALKGWGTGWMLFGAGVAGVVTENIMLGFMKASQEFASNPLKTVTDVVKDILPNIPGFKKPD